MPLLPSAHNEWQTATAGWRTRCPARPLVLAHRRDGRPEHTSISSHRASSSRRYRGRTARLRWPHHSWREMHQSFRFASESRYTRFQRADGTDGAVLTTRAAGFLSFRAIRPRTTVQTPGLQLQYFSGSRSLTGDRSAPRDRNNPALRGGHDGLAGLVAVHAELPASLHDTAVSSKMLLSSGRRAPWPSQMLGSCDGVCLPQRVPNSIHVPVGEDGDRGASSGGALLAQVGWPSARVLGLTAAAVSPEGIVSARGGDDQVHSRATHRLGRPGMQRYHRCRLNHVLGLVVGDGRGAVRAPVHDALAAVDDSSWNQSGEQLPHGAHVRAARA